MKLILGVLASLALCQVQAYKLDRAIDWSQIKYRDFKVPLPFGVENLVFNERIVGGQEVEANSLPYMAGIVIYTAEGTYFCGGSLISPRDVLTSARCLLGGYEFLVILGAHQITSSEPTQQIFYSNVPVFHPDLDAQLSLNDIALIKLGQDAELNEYVSILPLPTFAEAGVSLEGVTGLVSGWGITEEDTTNISDVLRAVEVQIIGLWDCNMFYVGALIGGHMCTSGVGGVGAFSGDVGGPLVVENKQIGIVSYSVENAWVIEWPTVYTRIFPYLRWLQNNSDADIREE